MEIATDNIDKLINIEGQCWVLRSFGEGGCASFDG